VSRQRTPRGRRLLLSVPPVYLYAKCRLSDYETHPIAALEALSLGRPVLVTATSGLQELADRGMARAIPLRSRPEVVAAEALRLLEQPAAACSLTLPTWDDCAAHLYALYRAVLEAVPCAS
jgi:hypothetical protein